MGTNHDTVTGRRKIQKLNESAYVGIPKDGVRESCDFEEFVGLPAVIDYDPETGEFSGQVQLDELD